MNRTMADVDKVKTIIEIVNGPTPYRIAQAIGIHHGRVRDLLTQLDKRGYLLYSDDEGRIYPYQEEGL